MSSYNELIKNFERIRNYMREFYVYGFKSRNDYDKKSARSYDDERRRLESWLGDYMRFERNRDGKNMFISIDSRVTVHNPLYRAFKAKSFTDRDITLHFIIFDILYDSTVKMTLPELLDTIDNEYLCDFHEPMVFDESTVRKKLKEYVEEGIICTEKEGRTVLYYRAPDNVKINGDAVQFFSEIAPCGVIGSFILDKLSEPQENFSFKHHYINVALDSDVLATIFDAMSKKSYITVTNLGRKSGEPKSVKLVPLRVFCSVQNGRQHLLAYEPGFRMIKSNRVDYLSDVKLDEVCENFDKYRALMNESEACMWGVNNRKDLEKLEKVEFTVFFDKNEDYIVGRLMREKRCGKVEQIDENHCRFTVETFNCNELVPWIRTFICRITDIHFSDPFVDKRFKKDLKKMYRMYGIEGGAEE